MNHPQRQTALRSPRRGGFTMLELLAVMAIIAILAALLVRAFGGAKDAAYNAATRSEISQLATAITSFKSTFGVEPPSHLQLWEAPSDIATQGDAESLRTRAILKRLWPQIDFTQILALDLNNNGVLGESMVSDSLTGAECLVFFLGGVLDATQTTLTGFSKNPAAPFAVQTAGESRDGPFFEFNSGRVVPSPAHQNFMVYIDPIPGQTAPYIPYVYASSYDSQGYITQITPGSIGTYTDTSVSSAVITLVAVPPPPPQPDLVDVYRTTMTPGGAAYNPKSFQIISPGFDRKYGNGGFFDPNQSNAGLTSSWDYDNITNFYNGPLSP